MLCKKILSLAVGILIISLVASPCHTGDAADRDFLNAVNNMVGGDVSTGSLVGTVTSSASWGSKDEATSNLRALIDTCVTFTFKFFGKTFNFPIYPYKRLTPLLYCSACRISSLTFSIN